MADDPFTFARSAAQECFRDLKPLADHPSAQVRRATGRAMSALQHLVATLKTEGQREAIRTEVDELEKKLADARARLRGGADAKARPSDKVIRDWARRAGIDCTLRGVVPQSVVDAYQAAHP